MSGWYPLGETSGFLIIVRMMQQGRDGNLYHNTFVAPSPDEQSRDTRLPVLSLADVVPSHHKLYAEPNKVDNGAVHERDKCIERPLNVGNPHSEQTGYEPSKRTHRERSWQTCPKCPSRDGQGGRNPQLPFLSCLWRLLQLRIQESTPEALLLNYRNPSSSFGHLTSPFLALAVNAHTSYSHVTTIPHKAPMAKVHERPEKTTNVACDQSRPQDAEEPSYLVVIDTSGDGLEVHMYCRRRIRSWSFSTAL